LCLRAVVNISLLEVESIWHKGFIICLRKIIFELGVVKTLLF
jgi:hypothetical protein